MVYPLKPNESLSNYYPFKRPYVIVSNDPQVGDFGPFTPGTQTAGIQEAINASNKVYIKSGTYTLAPTASGGALIYINKSNFVLEGEGSSTVINVASSFSADVMVVANSSSSISNILLKNFVIDATGQQPGYHGLVVGLSTSEPVSYCICDGVITKNTANVGGPYFNNGATKCIAVNCVSQNAGDAGFAFYNCSDCGIYNSISDGALEGIGIYGNPNLLTERCIISGNLITNAKDRGIYMSAGGSSGGIIRKILISNNSIYNVVGGTGLNGSAIGDDSSTPLTNYNNISIIGNIIDGTYTGGIEVSSIYDVIEGNIFLNTGSSGSGDALSSIGGYSIVKGNQASVNIRTGFNVTGSHNIVIGNIVENITAGNGLYVGGGYNIVASNIFRNNQNYGIEVLSNSLDDVIVDNDVTGNTYGIIVFDSGASPILVKGNRGYNPQTNLSLATNPPASGTTYQNPYPFPIKLAVPITLNPTSTAAATAYLRVGSSSTAGANPIKDQVNFPAGLTSVDGAVYTLKYDVPSGYYFEVDATNATIGTAQVDEAG